MTKSKILVINFCILSLGFCCFANSVKSKELVNTGPIERKTYNLLRKSNALQRKKQYASAIPILLQAAANDPTSYSSSVHSDLATCYRKQKQLKRALSEARKALKFDPANEQALYELAQCNWKLRNYKNCSDNLTKYIAMSSSSSNKKLASSFLKDAKVYGHVDEAKKAIKKGRYRTALKELTGAARFDPTRYSKTVHFNMAFCNYRVGKSEQAISEAKNVLKYDPGNVKIAYNIAIYNEDLGNYNEAIKWLKTYLSRETESAGRQRAVKLIRELREDNAKYGSVDNSKPDYLGQIGQKSNFSKWHPKSFPIKVYIYDGSPVRGYKPVYKNYILDSLDTWCKASGSKLSYKMVNDPSKANLKVRFRDRVFTSKDLKSHRLVAGLTSYKPTINNYYTKNLVQVLTVDSFNPKTIRKSGECASITMHEIGHAFGLDHSACPKDVMYFRSSTKQTGRPTRRDKATLAKLYADYPVIAFKPQAKAGPRIKYLPPPTFMPPKPSSDKIKPPIFMPPPKKKKLQPPLFKPPPKSHRPAKPIFTPPPPKKKRPKKKVKPPIFVPRPK